MSKLIIDATKDKIFLMIINNDINYHMSLENSKNNYEKLTILINEFLMMKNLDITKIIKFMLIEVREVLLELETLYQ